MKLLLPLCLFVLMGCSSKKETANPTPNIIIIYADDLGYGDVGCYNTDSKISTPNIDQLAKNGIMFTDAHSPSGICSPSRYAILTGSYSWRTSLKRGNPKPGKQPWISEGRITIANMLRDHGYNTACFGKWGLGADWEAAAKPERKGIDISADGIDYSKPVYAGRPFGFTHEELHFWYGHQYYNQKYPCHDIPGSKEKSDGARWYFENGMSKGGNPKFNKFDMEEAQMHYVEKTVDYINAAAKSREHKDYDLRDDAPFFIYLLRSTYTSLPSCTCQAVSRDLGGWFVRRLCARVRLGRRPNSCCS